MRHPSDGRLRAFLDNGLSQAEAVRVERHLAACRRCSRRAQVLRERHVRVEAWLSGLEPRNDSAVVSAGQAWQRLASYSRDRKERRMTPKLWLRQYRPLWAAAAVLIVLAVTFTVPSVRTLAGDLLGVFRVQSIEFTPIDEEALPDPQTLEALAPEIQRMFNQSLSITMEGEEAVLTETAVRERAQFPVRLPANRDGHYEWVPPLHVALEIDLAMLRGLFDELGYQNVALPDGLDGATVEADFRGMLRATYGACSETTSQDQDCLTFVQMAGPSAEVPGDLDVGQIGRVYLELLGLPPEEAEDLSKQIDWTTTLVLPFPHHVNINHEAVSVDGVTGTLIHSQSGYRPTPEYLLTWVKGDVICAVGGKGDYRDGIELANSLR